jgi:hypothetical protein
LSLHDEVKERTALVFAGKQIASDILDFVCGLEYKPRHAWCRSCQFAEMGCEEVFKLFQALAGLVRRERAGDGDAGLLHVVDDNRVPGYRSQATGSTLSSPRIQDAWTRSE